MVLRALYGPSASCRRTGPVRPQLVQPCRRRAGDGFLHSCPAQTIPEGLPRVRTVDHKRWPDPAQVLAQRRPGRTGDKVRRAGERSRQAMEVVADRSQNARAIRRLRQGTRHHVARDPHQKCALVRGQFQRPETRPPEPDQSPAQETAQA